MKKRFIHKVQISTALSIIAAILTIPAFSAVNFSIGGYYPGQGSAALGTIGMPFPIDTGGWHTFLNKNEGMLIRFRLTGPEENQKISEIELTSLDYVGRIKLRKDHYLLTGTSLVKFETAEGLKIGDTEEKVLKIYGTPDYNHNKDGKKIYGFKSGGRTLTVEIVNGKTALIRSK